MQYAQTLQTQLNDWISTEKMKIKTLKALKSKQKSITLLAKNSDYIKFYKQQKLEEMVQTFERFVQYKSHFIKFLTRYTIQDEDNITQETRNFVDLIKNWDDETYLKIRRTQEWENWSKPYSKELAILYKYQGSDVFYNIWCEIRESVAGNRRNFNYYLTTLYVQVKAGWDNLVSRASKSRLTFNDMKWFQHLNKRKELRLMQIPDRNIQQLDKDINDSLKLEKYIEFVDILIKIVANK